MNRKKSFTIILLGICFILGGAAFAQHNHEDGKSNIEANESYSGGMASPTYYYSRNAQMPEEKSWNENKVLQYSNTGEFAARRRCIIKQRPVGHVQLSRPLKSAGDCTMSRTIIQDEYWPAKTYTIPVVFHIIYKSDGTGNISDKRIRDQVSVLNQDYGAAAGSAGQQGYNTKIQFKLAGITRTANDNWFNDRDEVGFKRALGWDQKRYLNVYLNSASGYLGYAYLPQEDAGDVYDGVVLLYEAIGGRNNGFDTYDQGRTLVHEVGHYLGLLHTFEGYGCFDGYNSGDLIADTHSENDEHYDCRQTSTCGTPDDIHNYMNYTTDSCMHEFTPEQANRMVCSLVNYRPQLYQTTGSGTQPTITVSSPNGGERLTAASTYTIKWTSTGTVGNVKIEYTSNNGSNWFTITSSTSNDGAYSWKVPNIASTKCKVRIKEAADSIPVDTSNAVFTIANSGSTQPGITVTSPNGGEGLTAGSTYTIRWTSTGSVGNVKIEYTSNNGSNWSTITSSTSNDGAYSWKAPNIASTKCKIRIKEAVDSSPVDASDAVFTIAKSTSPGSKISLNRTRLNFSATNSGTVTGAQRLWLNNSGGGTLNWSVNVDQWWLKCTPTSGTNSGVLTISVNPWGLYPGNYSGTITISSPNASNSPRTVTVNLKVIRSSQESDPFGNFSTPLDGSTVRSSIPVTGWVLDDIGVKSVKIYRQVRKGSGYIGEAVLVEGARPDVEAAFPGYPMNHMAGWGYMMLTNFLPDGYSVIYAVATDYSGNRVTLGSSTIFIDNARAVKPFGAIDTPTQGGKASGRNFLNQGWTLTPPPNRIPKNGSTISVYIDGKFVGHPAYNIYRSDIAAYFPGYANSKGAMAYLEFDTTAYANGVHTIQWVVTDNAGNKDGVGSRYFTVRNKGNKEQAAVSSSTENRQFHQPALISADGSTSLRVKKGYHPNMKPQSFYPDASGNVTVEISELERLEIHFSKDDTPVKSIRNISPLPVGSTLDMEEGIFYWQAGLGYLGRYELGFVMQDRDGKLSKVNLLVNIVPHQ
jgi:hypothetical protein